MALVVELIVIAVKDDLAGQVVFACLGLQEAAGCAFLPYSA